MSASLKFVEQRTMGRLLRVLLVCACLLPTTPALAAAFDGVWTGTSTANTTECGSDEPSNVIVHIEDSWIAGSASNAGVIGTVIYGTIEGVDATGIAFEEDSGNVSLFTGTFNEATGEAELIWTDMESACTGTVTLDRQASYDSGYSQLWYGDAYVESGPWECSDATFVIALDLDGTTLRGSSVTSYGWVFGLAGTLTGGSVSGKISVGKLDAGDPVGGTFSGTVDGDLVTGTWDDGSGCSGTFWQSRFDPEDPNVNGWGTPRLADAGWVEDPEFGSDAVRADYISDSQTSKMSYTGDFYDGSARFSIKVSSEEGFDFLRFYIDGEMMVEWSGEVPWTAVTYDLTAGRHELVWSYEKDGSVSAGMDTAWARDFDFPVAGAASLEQQGYTVPPEADAGWLDEGGGVFRSEDISDGQKAQIERSGVYAAGGVVAFEYSVSSESGWDYLRFYMDGVEVEGSGWSGDISGWESVAYSVPAGQHTFTWSYEKDGSISAGEDRARIRNISYPQELQSLPPSLIDRGFVMPTTADMGWRGIYSSLDIGDNNTAQISYVGEFLDGEVGFWYSVASEVDFDTLEFYIDGSAQDFGTNPNSGNQPWTYITFPITAGEHTLIWSYEKDSSISSELGDVAWIAEISLPLPLGATPFHQGAITPDFTDAGWEEMFYTDNVDHNQQAQASFMGVFQDGNVTFDVAVSSEANWDYLRFFIDDVEQDAWSGEVPWESVSIPITAGEHTLLWSYEKDDSDILPTGSDTAWLRRIVLPLDLGGVELPFGVPGWRLDPGEGPDVLRSEAITHNKVAQIHRLGDFTAGQVQFDFKVSSEPGYDFLRFFVDGVEQGAWSGDRPWDTAIFDLPAGFHTLLWSYEKDVSVNSGEDAAWIGSVQLPPLVGSIPDPDLTPAGWTDLGNGEWGSDDIGDGAIASIERLSGESSLSAGLVRFALKVSSEENYDFLKFLIDGIERGRWSGEVDWTLVEFPITSGSHELLWVYEKDGSVSRGEDRARIRQIELPLQGTTSGDTRPPVTTVSPPGGTYGAAQQVTLSCDDGGGSGCQEIRYTLDGSTPAAGTIYSGPFTISSSATLRYRAKDNANNDEADKSAIYTININPPTVAITTPTEGTNVSVTSIAGTASDSDGDLDRVMVQVSKPGTAGTQYLNSSGVFVSTPTSIRATGTTSWSLSTASITWSVGTIHSINVSAIDVQGNTTTTSRQFGIGIAGLELETQFKKQVGGAIGVLLSSDSVTPNGTLNVSGILHLGGSISGLSRAGQPINLTLTKPDLVSTIPFATTTTNEQGAFSFNVTGFDQSGVYKITVNFPGNAILLPTTYETQVVVGLAGYAIIVQGKISSNSGLPAHKKSTDRIYDTLIARGFLKSNIRYFAYSSDLPADQYETPAAGQAMTAVQSSIQTWARDKLLAAPGPLYVVFVNHGYIDTFHMNDEIITPTDLDSWLDNLETVGLAGVTAAATAARAEKRIIILGSCFSGSFIPALQGGLNRVVITSAAADEQSFKGATEEDGVPVGEYFLQELFTALGLGSNLREAFRIATDLTEIFTFQGGLDPNSSDNPFQDSAIQHPLLDDDGNGIGSNVISSSGTDGETARNILLGVGPIFVDYAVEFTSVTETLYLTPGTFTATLHATLDVPNWTATVPRVAIRSPSTTLTQGTGTEQLSIPNLVEKDMSFNGTTGRWEFTYTNVLPDTGFNTDGKYDIIYLIRDASGRLSPIQRSVVYRRKSGNLPPAAFNLLAPADQADVNTVVVLDWEDAADIDLPITYDLIISSGPGFEPNKIVLRREGIIGSSSFVVGLTDNTQYYWKVEAVDRFGELRTSTQTRSFRTREPNSAPGIIQGIVLSDLGAARLVGATISNNLGLPTLQTDSEGRFTILTQAGAVTLTASLTSYQTTPQDLTVRAGEATQVTIAMAEAVVDTDGDGVSDDVDNCLSVSNATQTNTDGDSQGNACDLDDDNDGDPDTADNCPLVSNADQLNTDGDGQGNACDSDDDNDGVSDTSDAFPLDAAETLDTDRDGTGNNADTDDDGDDMTDADETAAGRNPLVNEASVIMIILQSGD